MSNNHFLKNKTSSATSKNRFQSLLLLEDETGNTPYTENSTKHNERNKKGKNESNEPISENTFTRQSSDKSSGYSATNMNNRRRTRNNLQENSKTNNVKKNTVVFSIGTEFFPDLSGKIQNNVINKDKDKPSESQETKYNGEGEKEEPDKTIEPSDNIINYKDVINKQNKKKLEDNDKVVFPGYVEITFKNRQIIYNYGATTLYEKQMLAKEILENSPNYIMNKAIDGIKKNLERYKRDYDDIHGEGAYDDMYVLPPVYEPEYDSDVDTDDDDSYYDYTDTSDL